MLSRCLPLFLASLVFASPAHAAEWWWVTSSGQKPNRALEFVDKESATADYSGRISAWTLKIYEIPQKDGVRKEKNFVRYNCKQRTIVLVETIDFGNNDRLINSFTWKPYEQQEQNVVPDSVGESRWKFVCQGKMVLTSPLQTSPEEFAAAVFRAE